MILIQRCRALIELSYSRFIINGMVATALHYSVLTFLIKIVGMRSAGLANGLASTVGIAASYLGSKYFVFGSRKPTRQTLPRFLTLYSLVVGLHTVLLGIWSDIWQLPYNWGFILATLAATIVTYFGNQRLVFAADH